LPWTVNSCIHTEFENRAEAHPGHIAISSWDGDLTYDQLNKVSTQLASKLTSQNVAPETVVPLCLEKSKWAIVSMMAILKAGGAFVAVDPTQPISRTKAILDQVDAKLVISSTAQKHVFSDIAVQVIEVSDAHSRGWADKTDWVAPLVQAKHSAYAIFTSGSTGTPKGILVEHRSFCSGVALHAPAQFLNKESRVLQFASYTHDTCLAEILTTLCVGGTVCVPSEEQRKNALVEFINEKAVNWAVLTPSFITSISPEDVPTLKVIVLAGERLSQSNIRRWAESVKLLSGYGVSECSVVTTISEPLRPDTRASNIGLPAGGVCWIVDPSDTNKLKDIGEVGEILIEGPTVSRGYIKNPSANSRAFIDPPQWLLPILSTGERQTKLYRTGDLGRQNSDGTLDFICRIDSQIKISGRRIELGEIEHYVSAHEDVKLCMVVYPQAGAYRNKLVAVLQLHHGDDMDEHEENGIIEIPQKSTAGPCKVKFVAQEVQNKAPSYMVPSQWLVIKRFPRLPSAKIDRRSVQEWLETQTIRHNLDDASPLIPSDDSIALKVAAEVAKVVERGDDRSMSSLLSRDTAFAKIGVDSIKAISLMKSLQRMFGIKIQVEHLIENDATPTTIAGYIRQAQSLGSNEYHAPDGNLQMDLGLLKKSLHDKIDAAPIRLPSQSRDANVVLLTGATGYLGQEILRILLRSNFRVISLLRGSSAREGCNRIIARAITSGWWSEEYNTRLEVWLGDLSKPKLGLSPNHWNLLSGHGLAENCVNAIVHNGASVHWTEGARALWPVNVSATANLLEAAFASRFLQHFVFVSGGAKSDGPIDRQLASARDGYTQTKLLSQALIQDVAARSKKLLNLRLSFVKPGFIIGNAIDGIANPRDYLWRFVASAIDLGVYDSSTREAWITMSTNQQVAEAIVNQVFPSATDSECEVLLECGIREKELWQILVRNVGYRLRPVSHQTWVRRLQKSLEKARESHLLWPLHNVLEEQ
ncbi:acetyl-CoA synthetase-like protein, partial [Lepidopterella palustris CBS 459.81]